MIIMVWFWIEYKYTLVWWGMLCNTFVHTLMYYYYWITLVYPGIKIWWKKYLTQLQIFQFFSVFVMIFVWFALCVENNYQTTQIIADIKNDSIFDQTAMVVSQSWNNFKAWYFQETPHCSSEFWINVTAQCLTITFLYLFISFFINSYLTKKQSKKKLK